MQEPLEGIVIFAAGTAFGFLLSELRQVHPCPPTPPLPPPPVANQKSFISEADFWQAISVNSFNHLIKVKGKIMAVTLKDSQKVTGTLSFVDAKGAPTDVADGSVSVTSSDEAIATVSYDDANNKIEVVAGNPGVAAISIKATNQQGAELPFDDVAVEVTSGDAVSGTVTFDTPTNQ